MLVEDRGLGALVDEDRAHTRSSREVVNTDNLQDAEAGGGGGGLLDQGDEASLLDGCGGRQQGDGAGRGRGSPLAVSSSSQVSPVIYSVSLLFPCARALTFFLFKITLFRTVNISIFLNNF